MTNIRKSFLNKNLLDDLMDGSFWFGKNENKAEVEKVINTRFANNNVKENFEQVQISFLDMGKEKESKIIIENIQVEKVSKTQEEDVTLEDSNLNNPLGYIKLIMINTNPNELFVNHNITMQYLTINGNKFIKELRLTNQGRELDCYSEGENKSLSIEKISSTQLLLTLEEKSSKLDKFIIINGAII